jgi:hypothetical protein
VHVGARVRQRRPHEARVPADQGPLLAAHGRVAERIERGAAEPTEPSQEPEGPGRTGGPGGASSGGRAPGAPAGVLRARARPHHSSQELGQCPHRHIEPAHSPRRMRKKRPKWGERATSAHRVRRRRAAAGAPARGPWIWRSRAQWRAHWSAWHGRCTLKSSDRNTALSPARDLGWRVADEDRAFRAFGDRAPRILAG